METYRKIEILFFLQTQYDYMFKKTNLLPRNFFLSFFVCRSGALIYPKSVQWLR